MYLINSYRDLTPLNFYESFVLDSRLRLVSKQLYKHKNINRIILFKFLIDITMEFAIKNSLINNLNDQT